MLEGAIVLRSSGCQPGSSAEHVRHSDVEGRGPNKNRDRCISSSSRSNLRGRFMRQRYEISGDSATEMRDLMRRE